MQLGLEDDTILYDDTKLSFVTRMDFHWWMQQRFAALGVKKLHMCPISKVGRAHIRLDATHLFMATWESLKPSPVRPPPMPT
jgi:hypothetical protein